MKLYYFLIVFGMLGVFYIGFFVGNYDKDIANEKAEERDEIQVYGSSTSANHSETIEVPKKLPIPSIDLEVFDDKKDGWNLKMDVKNLKIIPKKASTDHVDGEGHIHLYIDDKKITRIYGDWYYIPTLKTGISDILVVLSANNHSEYTYNGELISELEYIISIN